MISRNHINALRRFQLRKLFLHILCIKRCYAVVYQISSDQDQVRLFGIDHAYIFLQLCLVCAVTQVDVAYGNNFQRLLITVDNLVDNYVENLCLRMLIMIITVA